MKHLPNFKSTTMFMVLFSLLLTFGSESNAKIIKVPNVAQFVKITSESAVLYRLPSLNSGKLMEWSSDGGSIDTYSMLMYEDTEKDKYPIGGLAESYANPFTPQRNDIFPIVEKKEGWYCVEVTNSDVRNSKKAWIKSIYCRLASMKETDASTIQFPAYTIYDENTETNKPGKLISAASGKKRGTGKYASIIFNVTYRPDESNFVISFILPLDNKVLVAETYAEYNKSTAAKGVSMKKENVQSDMDDYSYDIFRFMVPKATTNVTEKIKQYLSTCPDVTFDMLLKDAFEGEDQKMLSFYYLSPAGTVQQYYFDPSKETELPCTNINILL